MQSICCFLSLIPWFFQSWLAIKCAILSNWCGACIYIPRVTGKGQHIFRAWAKPEAYGIRIFRLRPPASEQIQKQEDIFPVSCALGMEPITMAKEAKIKSTCRKNTLGMWMPSDCPFADKSRYNWIFQDNSVNKKLRKQVKSPSGMQEASFPCSTFFL